MIADSDFRRLNSNLVELTCWNCRESATVELTDAQEKQWRDGALIQRVTPQLNGSLREMLISGTCKACWSKYFDDD